MLIMSRDKVSLVPYCSAYIKSLLLEKLLKNCIYLPYINSNILNWTGLLVLWQTNGYIGFF